MLPSSIVQVVLVIVAVVPGFVYQGVRISVRGRLPGDVEWTTRLIRSIATSAVFALLYLIAFGGALAEAAEGRGDLVDHPRLGAVLALLGAFLIPAGAAVALAWVPRPAWLTNRIDGVLQYDPTPTAWDKVFTARSPCFVRVLTASGEWMAGYFGKQSYASSYPEPHQLYLERSYAIDADGAIGEAIDGSLGSIIDCSGAQLIEIVELAKEEKSHG
jgi:hypothetical protein